MIGVFFGGTRRLSKLRVLEIKFIAAYRTERSIKLPCTMRISLYSVILQKIPLVEEEAKNALDIGGLFLLDAFYQCRLI